MQTFIETNVFYRIYVPLKESFGSTFDFFRFNNKSIRMQKETSIHAGLLYSYCAFCILWALLVPLMYTWAIWYNKTEKRCHNRFSLFSAVSSWFRRPEYHNIKIDFSLVQSPSNVIEMKNTRCPTIAQLINQVPCSQGS